MTVSDGSEALLPSGVPHLHFDGLPPQLHRLQAEVDPAPQHSTGKATHRGGEQHQTVNTSALPIPPPPPVHCVGGVLGVVYPMVGMYSTENSFWVYLSRRELFPAPESPNVRRRTMAGFDIAQAERTRGGRTGRKKWKRGEEGRKAQQKSGAVDAMKCSQLNPSSQHSGDGEPGQGGAALPANGGGGQRRGGEQRRGPGEQRIKRSNVE